MTRLNIFCKHLKELGYTIVGRQDNVGRWYPKEPKDCCKSIREPSRAYPYSLWTHCKSNRHILVYLDIKDEGDLPKLLGHTDSRVVGALEKALKGE
jgi:hypothetical protein